VSLYVSRLLVAVAAFSKAQRSEQFVEFLSGVEEVVGRRIVELLVKPLAFCHAFVAFLWDMGQAMGEMPAMAKGGAVRASRE